MPRHVFTLYKTWRKTPTANCGRKKSQVRGLADCVTKGKST
ncbi:hypothetical protein QIT80_gp42 (endogenous virus) [Pseudomonas phage phiAH14a]|uniref:Uncharacterized protein n=1 Tax=Pseudomonas phage phiAH14a TaxID=1805958 RepID=A0A1B0VMF1_9CAUD|nr:hypothetical protein QIT80_gp42 [Pseudomonas phage phiAH14a]AMW64502.1 hypothetical protein AH14a_p42 [Pseudomonas phage phiAH14a]